MKIVNPQTGTLHCNRQFGCLNLPTCEFDIDPSHVFSNLGDLKNGRKTLRQDFQTPTWELEDDPFDPPPWSENP